MSSLLLEFCVELPTHLNDAGSPQEGGSNTSTSQPSVRTISAPAKYSSTWYVSVVLSYIKSIGLNTSWPLRLLSICEAHNPICAHCHISIFVLGQEGFTSSNISSRRSIFKLPGLSKTSRPGQDPKVSFHASFPFDQDLCPVACLREYEARTRDFRPVDLSTPYSIFLSYIQPQKPVTSANLARLIKVSLKGPDIDSTLLPILSEVPPPQRQLTRLSRCQRL